MRLGEIATLELVKLYMKYECLWNTNHPDYRNKDKRGDAYNNIVVLLQQAVNIKMDVSELKTKICHLRNTYTQEIKKIIRRSTDPQNMYKPSLLWFSEMDSGLKNLKCLKTSVEDIIPPTATDHLNDNGYWPETSLENNDVNGVDNSNPVSEEEEDEDYTNDGDEYIPNAKIKLEAERDSTYEERPKRKRKDSYSKDYKKKHKSRDKVDDKATDNFVNLVGQLTGSEPISEDEYDIYGRYVASQLRKMKPSKAIRIQLELHKIVSDARLREIS